MTPRLRWPSIILMIIFSIVAYSIPLMSYSQYAKNNVIKSNCSYDESENAQYHCSLYNKEYNIQTKCVCNSDFIGHMVPCYVTTTYNNVYIDEQEAKCDDIYLEGICGGFKPAMIIISSIPSVVFVGLITYSLYRTNKKNNGYDELNTEIPIDRDSV